MATLNPTPVRNLQELSRFEQAMPFAQRIAARSIIDLFAASAQAYPDRTALTMIMTGAADEVVRRVSYRELLQLIHRAANFFHAVGGPRAGVAYMLPSLVETHVTLWAAETAGFAVPINFLLQAEH
ncbi:MAG: acyl-CoA synthetase, partial [Burkholderiaceae bacterium]